MSVLPKGWTKLIDEAVSRIVSEEVKRCLEARFPEVKEAYSTKSEPGFNYSMRAYIEKRWTEIMAADPEIDKMIRDGLAEAIKAGFAKKEL